MPQNKTQPTPDFIPAEETPDFIPAEGGNTPTPATIKASPTPFSKPWLKEKFYNAADAATNAFPAIGGITGGLLGAELGPGAIGTAALGGAAGESARQLSRRALGFEDSPQTSLDAAKGIGKEALKQGAYEAGGRVLSGAAKAAAPKVAEAAIAPGKRLLKSIPEDVDIGKTVLNESTGYTPKTVAKQLKAKIATTSADQDRLARAAAEQGATVPITPARQLVADEMRTAAAKNSPNYLKDVQKIQDQLANQYGPNGKPLMQRIATPREGAGFVPSQFTQVSERPIALPEAVDPVRARQLKQGIGMEIGSWNPESQAAIDPLAERVYGSINQGFHEAVPGSEALDKSMTSLIPTEQAAWNTSFNPGITRNIYERFARPTGAAIGTIYGADRGYKEGGLAGGVAGGAAGLTLPLLISSPEGMMTAARVLDSRGMNGLIKGVRVAAPLIEGESGREHKRRGNTENEQD